MKIKSNEFYSIVVCLMFFILSMENVCFAQKSGKQLYIPKEIWKVPKGNNFDDSSSKYNRNYMRQSDNIAIIWSNIFGAHPEELTDKNKRFNPDSILAASEYFYNYYVDSLAFVQKGKSISDKYKVLFVVTDDNDGTAYGGGSEENPKIGILWTPTSRISYAPYGAVAHELGHVFQTFVSTDGGVGFTTAGQSLYEMTSQYMLWQVYPDWMTFENYHVKDFLRQSYLAFLHPDNMYHSPFILEYWSEKNGKNFVGKLWCNAVKGEDAVLTYKRINKLSQSAFNDDIFEADRHMINWDLKRIKALARPYANKFFTKLDTLEDGWLKCDSVNLPQNYGFNAINIPLEKFKKGKISLQFKGLSDNSTAGWRYGFVAETNEGECRYSKIGKSVTGKLKYKVPGKTAHLWLVVMGAPRSHTIVNLEHGKNKQKQIFMSYPYQFLLD